MHGIFAAGHWWHDMDHMAENAEEYADEALVEVGDEM